MKLQKKTEKAKYGQIQTKRRKERERERERVKIVKFQEFK